MCLARALCHKAKIIVLDEATSSVDFETDEKVRLLCCRRLSTYVFPAKPLVVADSTYHCIGVPRIHCDNSSSSYEHYTRL
jgi:ABC-type microcin C transport system duplicated ATPase subunit YejF